MPKPFLTLPMSHFVERSTPPRESHDEIEIVDDSNGDLEAPAPDDAATNDDTSDGGGQWAPTELAMLRHRLFYARRVMEARLVRLVSGSDDYPPGLGLGLDTGARLAARDAPGEANKPALDRWKPEPGAAISVGLGLSEPPRQVKDRRGILSWADQGRDASRARADCDCERRFIAMTREELLRQIRELRATEIPEAMLRRSYTRHGLMALLCGHLGKAESPSLKPPMSHPAKPSAR